jgi:hypothetical protein
LTKLRSAFETSMAAQQQQRRPGRHTILLYQPSQDPLTRTYVDHESTEAAVDGARALRGPARSAWRMSARR